MAGSEIGRFTLKEGATVVVTTEEIVWSNRSGGVQKMLIANLAGAQVVEGWKNQFFGSDWECRVTQHNGYAIDSVSKKRKDAEAMQAAVRKAMGF